MAYKKIMKGGGKITEKLGMLMVLQLSIPENTKFLRVFKILKKRIEELQ